MANQEHDEELALPQSTLLALASFLDEQSAAQEALAALSAESYYDNSPQLGQDDFSDPDLQFAGKNDVSSKSATAGSSRMKGVSLKEFKRIFKEDWQLSQFWYTEDTGNRLSEAILKLSSPNSRISFLCCPTGYVAFNERCLPSQEVRLFEYDTRFAIFAKGGFVHYDLDEPISFPGADELYQSQDIIVIDPPFHAEASQRKIASTVSHLLRPGGHLILLTGTSLAPLIDEIYVSLPKLRRRSISIEHDGTGRLKNSYSCWAGGGSKADESGFGEVIDGLETV